MKRNAAGITLLEVAVVLVCIVVAVVLILPSLQRFSSGRSRTPCASNLRHIAQGSHIYAHSYAGRLPVAGKATEDGAAVGFHEGDRHTDSPARTGAHLDDNVTASLWLLVRDGVVKPDAFVCPQTGDEPDPADLTTSGVPLAHTFDFLDRRHLSYSPINMYHEQVGDRWTISAHADVPWLADNNASDHPKRAAADREEFEPHPGNSPNHGGEYQTVLFADGRVEGVRSPLIYGDDTRPRPRSTDGHPWAGRSVYAMYVDGERRPVELEHDAGTTAAGIPPSGRPLRVEPGVGANLAWLPLLPLHGNDGVNLSSER